MLRKSLFMPVLAMFMFLFAFAAHAQGKGAMAGKAPEEKVENRIKRLTAKLQLTDEQVPGVKEALLVRIKAVEAARNQTEATKSDKGKQVKRIHDEFDNKMKTILTAEQYTKYEAMREEMKENIQEKRGKQ